METTFNIEDEIDITGVIDPVRVITEEDCSDVESLRRLTWAAQCAPVHHRQLAALDLSEDTDLNAKLADELQELEDLAHEIRAFRAYVEDITDWGMNAQDDGDDDYALEACRAVNALRAFAHECAPMR